MKRNQYETPLYTALLEYSKKNVIPFDVPGHKQGRGNKELVEFLGEKTLKADVNSMKPLDNIGNPIGVIRESEELMAEAFFCDNSFFLVNGTSAGVQAMIMSVCHQGDKIIIPRNVHKSAINGLILSGAHPIYVQPEIHEGIGISLGISVESYKRAIEENPDAKALFVINPTYYGIVSDLEKIISLGKKHGLVTIVDEAHGTHFYFSDDFPNGAMKVGADISSVSLHKTGGSLTQSSVLLSNNGLVDKGTIKTTLNLTQSTSASYLLMTSLDITRKMLATEGKDIFHRVRELSIYGRNEINKIEGYYAFSRELIDDYSVYDFDETKLSINTTNIGLTGIEVYDILRDEYNIQVEFGDSNNILAIISVGDTKENIDELIKGLKDIKRKYKKERKAPMKLNFRTPSVIVSPRDAFYSNKKRVRLEDSVGEISGESIMAYPPGIPIVSPGERIDGEMIEYIMYLKEKGSILTGTEDPEMNWIKVLGV
ncbi:MAG: aminotransferase class I/II-fold pyridoxal phosphate-dependent enzyme [Anaeromicrobium sp.]|jgi:arginine/lysine/ornithine decarboxylase|uniref:aminotransferase class I/II-fold pyridoxal phosphate-dependent enzyme n=1 Tax=Anaeromicrobium sp. TaxID=1929132 RepID=UPI0025D3496A|nr:aminotransferase class I/II-fold pyridoxal phosphate-dependent enzyme [Anaeromicrobium sp.]MCT4593128.1 aminotransferase class I/II-fold pyridoxal phosphate-dependent enzyme [Anaeromicrobium sp.]